MTLVGNFVGIAISLVALVWNVFVHSQESRARKYADQAERAGHLLVLLRSIDLGGADTGLNVDAARGRHDKQVHDLERVVRISAAEFSARALHPGASRTLIGGLAAYGLFLLGDAVVVTVSASHLPGADQLGTLVIAGVIGSFGIVGVIWAGVLGRRRGEFRHRQQEAGITVRSLREEARAVLAGIRTVVAVRRLRRNPNYHVAPAVAEDSTS